MDYGDGLAKAVDHLSAAGVNVSVRADKAGMQARGVTEKAYVEQCKGGTETATLLLIERLVGPQMKCPHPSSLI